MSVIFVPEQLGLSLLGGVLIGAAAGGLLLVNGRVAGISGILSAATARGTKAWHWAFLAGLLAAGSGAALSGRALPAGLGAGHVMLLAVAGLLAGVGTRLSGGCTSGHGVCGLARLSPRSLVAVLTFMLAAGVTVFLERHGL
ncbi:YeeE/YedE family protein [Acidocella sp.]|uniref:YeeE/YedE family protein n=1 Tax=Acidocella sp. TaxID=50710 RepID=UPI00262D7734|nr:YeeE/YedE family protein [Acidocella sp.]